MPPIGEPKLVTVNPTRYAPILLLEMGIHGMEWNWASIIGLVTTILTFATALLAYLRERIKRPSESVSTAHLRIRHLSRAACSIVLTSYSVIPGTLVDYGKNSRNLDVLLENL